MSLEGLPMWWFNRDTLLNLKKLKRRRGMILLVPFCLLLTACGFRPLYTMGERGAICYPLKIATISNRNGQILRNHLLDLLTPGGPPLKPKYTLEVKIFETVIATEIRIDESTNRKKVTISGLIILKDSKNKRVYLMGTSAINSFPILSQNYYSDIVAEDFAKRETLRNLAEKISLLVISYLDTHCDDKDE